MRLKTTRTTLISYGDDALRAAAIFENELFYRAGIRVKNGRENAGTVLSLISDAGFCDSDVFEISGDEKKLTFRADDIRGLIFAMGLFLRKA